MRVRVFARDLIMTAFAYMVKKKQTWKEEILCANFKHSQHEYIIMNC